MTRRTVLGAICGAAYLAAMTLAGHHVIAADGATSELRLADQRRELLLAAARGLRENLDDVGGDLALVTQASHSLDAMVEVKPAYAWVEVHPASGQGVRVGGRRPGLDPRVASLAEPVIAQLVARAAEAPGELAISPGLSPSDDAAAWYRVVARADRDRTVAVAVIDMRRVMAPSTLLHAEGSRLLVLSAHAVPAPTSDAAPAAMMKAPPPAITAVLAEAARGHATSAPASAELARSLDLGDAPVIASAAPIVIDGGQPWILLDATSTASLAAAHHALILRIVALGAVGLVIGAAGALLSLAHARRDAAMRERVRYLEHSVRAEKLATAGQLAAGIAHEIGTPLNVARGRAELALARLGDDHPEAAGQREAIAQIDLVTVLIRQLLGYVRIEGETRAAIDLTGTVQSVLAMLATQAATHHVELALDETAGAAIMGDEAHVQQIVVNLVVNAIDACEPGGRVEVRTRVDRDRAHPRVALEVTDTGHGIAAEHRAVVFDPFFTTKKRGQGTGLGLWIVAQLARAQGAEIEVASKPGAGSTFRVVWPGARPRVVG